MTIRLLTFSHLSLLREHAETSSWDAAVDALSTVTLSFGCHLLQAPALECPLEALGSNEQQERLKAALKDRHVETLLMTASGDAADAFPPWLQPEGRRLSNLDELCDVIRSWQSAEDPPEFQWLHVDLTDAERRRDWIASALQAVAETVPVCPDQTVIVTATGGEHEDSGRFESLLWEECLRVPLWVADPRIEAGQEHRPTGSYDVLETLLTALGATGEPSLSGQAADLVAARAAGGDEERLIRVAAEGAEAVRSSEFLLVRTHSDQAGERLALYGKPHDVWNVHDVSREFPDVTDELLECLRVTSSADGG